MIPLRDSVPSRRFPVVNWTLIGLCTLGFYLEFLAGLDTRAIIERYGLVPTRVAAGTQSYLAFVTSMFLHGGVLHLLGNLLFLHVFGDNVEDRFGHVGYLLFYLLGGVAAGLTHVFANPDAELPVVGASGAIGAVMGAYFLLHPRARIDSALVFFVFVRIVPVPAGVYLLVWFGLQLLEGAASGSAGSQMVAWWAHIGGFVFGVLSVVVLGRGRRGRLGG